jgi:hypothetical protein
MFMTEICVCEMLCVDVGTGYAVIPQNMFIINTSLCRVICLRYQFILDALCHTIVNFLTMQILNDLHLSTKCVFVMRYTQ